MDTYAVGATVPLHFTTNAAAGAAVAPSSAFEAADVILYKDTSATQRSSTSGWTMTSPFDSVTGLHLLAIDLSDNTDAGFYAAGSVYTAILSCDETIDSQTPITAIIGKFRIGPDPVNLVQWKGTAPNDLVSSRVDVSVGAIAANAITAASMNSDAGAEIADAVWDEALAGHAGAGSAGEALAAAGTAGDPWSTALPGAYGAGTAGKIVGDNLNATISGVPDAVWDEALAGHAGAGSAGEALSAAGAAGDPLASAVPGAYAAGTAGYVLGTTLTPANIADGLLDRANAIETGVTPRGALRLLTAAEAGNVVVGDTTTTISNLGNTKTRITAEDDADGNRTITATDTT